MPAPPDQLQRVAIGSAQSSPRRRPWGIMRAGHRSAALLAAPAGALILGKDGRAHGGHRWQLLRLDHGQDRQQLPKAPAGPPPRIMATTPEPGGGINQEPLSAGGGSRTGRRALRCQRGGLASYRMKDGYQWSCNGRALFSVKYHDGIRAPQPPPFPPLLKP